MPERASKRKKTLDGHNWVGAAYIPLTDQQASFAVRYGHTKVLAADEVDVLEVQCLDCRQAHWKVKDRPCPRTLDERAHLIGGPQGTRKRRNNPDDGDPIDLNRYPE